MIERDKEYYNQKISELYKVIENQEKIIRELQEENQELKIQVSAREEVANKYKEIIDKAIEYMKYNATSNYFDEEKNMFRREIDLLEKLIIKIENYKKE